MKFGKSYMETLASPSFPKEWREGAIEYKQLKKLINGVVAELESLGLSADVLRDLMVAPEEEERQRQQQHDNGGGPLENVEAAAKPPSTMDVHNGQRATPSSLLSRSSRHRATESDEEINANLHDLDVGKKPKSSKVMQDASLSLAGPDECSDCAEDLKRHKEEHHSSTSAAAEWVASIAHADHTRSHRSRRRSSRKGSNSGMMSSDSADVDYLPSASPFENGNDDHFHGTTSARSQNSSDQGEGPSNRQRQHLAPPSSAGLVRQNSQDAYLSPDDERIPRFSSKMGKKDLEAFRRRNSSADRNIPAGESHEIAPPLQEVHDWGGNAWRERAKTKPSRPKTEMKSGKWVQGKDGRRARAEYELGGTAERPEPRIRLFIESPVTSDDDDDDERNLPADEDAGAEGDDECDAEASGEDEGVAKSKSELDNKRSDASPGKSRLDALEKTMGSDTGADSDEERFEELTESPHGSLKSRPRLQGEPGSPMQLPAAHQRIGNRAVRTREIVIPLNADTEFLDTLTGALANLSTLQEQQRIQFEQNTEALCKVVSQVAGPSSKNDMYAWREIFALWCEMQIFESQREKDRGELSVEESEQRLKRFAEELSKRGWDTHALDLDAAQRKEHGKKSAHKGTLARFMHHGQSSNALPMKDPRSIAALEEFLKLNLALLDVKKFQRVNVEAARKILKKHDKRTALTASSDFGAFVEQQESIRTAAASAAAGIGVSSLVAIPEHKTASTTALVSSHGAATHPSLAALLPTSTSALMSSSLPHILLSLMSTTLLPILPSIDDYSCAICTDVAWRPIKLDCGHLFCIRCLVKLQKQGKADCPLCRAPGVVESADEHNMDPDTVTFLQEWFPKEVKSKQKENDKDRHKEELLELGIMENERCVVL